MSNEAPALVWFRQDLRLTDNPALAAAAASGRPLAFIYVLDDESPAQWRIGGAGRWWLHHSLSALSDAITKRGGRLLFRRGNAGKVLEQVVKEIGAAEIHWNRLYEPYAVKRDTALKALFSKLGCAAHSHNGALLFEPWEVETAAGGPFKVFTPFWRACRARGLPRTPVKLASTWRTAQSEVQSDALQSWALLPVRPNWAAGFKTRWTPGETGAKRALSAFVRSRIEKYANDRDLPAKDATSHLSPHLHWGEISPVQIYSVVDGLAGAEKFLSEIGWREFSHHLLFHFPTLPEAPWRSSFEKFGWRKDENAFRAWSSGQTGYPIVDAGMRELWATGYMHNRVRMITASFLIKHLLIDWRRGQDWFWDTLVDADLANNSASWQWVAGSGADASPYFRIFNPIVQGERYDPNGDYVRRWAPELRDLPAKYIHAPWTAPEQILADAKIALGVSYPRPVVDHAEARARALAAFQAL
ncbi:MAG: deoxyribodipyrimidine photo-lyase [Caulobacterales bacterium]